MSDAQHTPGPWAWYGPTRGEGLTFSHEAHVGPGEGNDSCGPIAAVSGDDTEQAVANARFIAAAPEMLFALHLFGLWEHLPADRGGKDGQKGRAWTAFVEAKDAAIAKATGD